MRRAWIAAGVAAVMLTAAPAARAVTSAHAPEPRDAASASVVRNYAVAADGSVTPLAATDLGAAPQDIAITPDGRFAYVTLATDAIGQFVRAANGALAANPNGAAVSTGASSLPLGIIVNPQGTRVYYAKATANSVGSRPINANGTLGDETLIPFLRATPQFLAMTADGANLYVADSDGTTIHQFSVDPATGIATPKLPPTVAWPVSPPPGSVGRLTIAPGGGTLYATAEKAGTGIARYPIDAAGALGSGEVDAATQDAFGERTLAISPGGAHAWAPSSTTGATLGGRINQFLVSSSGELSKLADPLPTASPTDEAVAHPGGATLYLARHDALALYAIAPGGTLTASSGSPAVEGQAAAGLVLAPSQAPVASFAATVRPAGQSTSFDASASADPDGTIARYDWNFGDGTVLANGGATPAHVYAAAGTYTVTLTLTDADGTSTSRLWTGARMLRNGGPSAQATRPVTIAAAPIVATPPQPRKGRSVTVVAERGTIRVRVPGSRRYVPIDELREIPLGSIIDARKGRVRITAEVDARTGRTQSSLFWDWYFRVTQTKGSKPIVVATLVKGSFAGCTPRAAASSSARASGLVAQAAATKRKSKRKVRRLWGRGNGSFRTSGKRSSATVRGTYWLVEDRCDGTLTRVRTGIVDVRDLRTRKTIRLRAGRSYLAKAP